MWDEEDLGLLGAFGLSPRLAASLFASDSRPFDIKSRSLRPLVSTKVTHKAVVLTFDLPYVERKQISVTATDTTVEVEAGLKRPAAVRVGWTVQGRVRFNRYKALVELPTPVRAQLAKASFKNGLLTVRIPLAGSGTRVKVR